MRRTHVVELTDDQIVFVRSCLEFVAEQIRRDPPGPVRLGGAQTSGDRELTMIATLESALSDAQEIG